ncbi:Copia protein, partial [Mucuna pruriens]
MIVEMQALEQSGSWELVSLPSSKKAIGCRWLDRMTQLIVSKLSWYRRLVGNLIYLTITTSDIFFAIGVVSQFIKKQNIVAHSSAEAKYRAMASATYELIWIKQLIQELKFADVQSMKLYCDNQANLHIASNPIFHERIKYIEIDCHFVREKLLAKEISTKFVNSSNQLGDILTISLKGPHIQVISSKLGAYNLYVLA